MKARTTPESLTEAILYYSSEAVCVEFLSQLKWGGAEKCCPKCGSTAVYGLRTRPVFKCRDCKKQFSIKVGTVMQDSPLPITKWVPALWMVVNCKNGISSCEMARALNITQKSAWHMCHRIREAVSSGSVMKLTGTVEADEVYIGGSRTNWSNSKRANTPMSFDHKTPVMAFVERGGDVRAKVIDGAIEEIIKAEVRKNVAPEAVLYTDSAMAYKGLGSEYWHSTVSHIASEYVRGDVSTNTVEGSFALLKRCIKGTYIHMAPFHLDRYLDEQGFRYNHRKGNDSDRFIRAASQIFGKTLTYAELTGRVAL